MHLILALHDDRLDLLQLVSVQSCDIGRYQTVGLSIGQSIPPLLHVVVI
jgi:hypothetical protein